MVKLDKTDIKLHLTAPMRPRAKHTEGASPRTHSRKTLPANYEDKNR